MERSESVLLNIRRVKVRIRNSNMRIVGIVRRVVKFALVMQMVRSYNVEGVFPGYVVRIQNNGD